MREIIEKYAHDFRDMKMSENVLERMLRNMSEELLNFMIEDSKGAFGDSEVTLFIRKKLNKLL